MGRLKANDNTERRTAFVGANVTAYERSEVERRAAASGFRLSDYIRLRLLSDRPGATTKPRLSPELGRKLIAELARVGNNLNQLARHANATGNLPASSALDAVLDEIVKATEVLIQL